MEIAEPEKLKALSFQKQLVFTYLTCERFFPNYGYFSNSYEFGNPQILREGINLVYNSIFDNSNIGKQKIETLLKAIHDNIPGSKIHGSYYGTIAFDTSAIVYEAINLLKKEDVEKSLTAISLTAIDIIDCFIQNRDDMDYGDEGFEEKISSDAAMQKEMAIQNGIVSYLEKIYQVDPSDLETLMQLQSNESQVLLVESI